jgi:hypothetical protein
LLEKPAFTEKKKNYCWKNQHLLKKKNYCWKNQHLLKKEEELLLEKSAFTENNLIIAGMVKSTTSLLLVG